MTFWAGTAVSQSFFSSKSTVEQSNKTVQRIERLERQVSRISKLTQEVNALKTENRQLLGDLELQNHQIESLKRKQRDLYIDIDQRLSRMQEEIKQKAKVPIVVPVVPVIDNETAEPLADTGGAAAPVQTAVVDPAGEEDAYRKAYDLLRPEQRRFKEAVVAFGQFLRDYPSSHLAPNAQYWMAEASYVRQDNTSALPAFKKVVEQYPDSGKVPGALLKIGYILGAQGNKAEAEAYLKKVITEYPASPSAGMARQRLKKINSSKP